MTPRIEIHFVDKRIELPHITWHADGPYPWLRYAVSIEVYIPYLKTSDLGMFCKQFWYVIVVLISSIQ